MVVPVGLHSRLGPPLYAVSAGKCPVGSGVGARKGSFAAQDRRSADAEEKEWEGNGAHSSFFGPQGHRRQARVSMTLSGAREDFAQSLDVSLRHPLDRQERGIVGGADGRDGPQGPE